MRPPPRCSALLQTLFGYDALSTGLVMSPSGIFAVIAMPVVGRLIGRENGCSLADRRGLADHDRRELLDVPAQPGHQPGQVVWPRVVLVLGLGDVLCARECRGLSLYAAALRGAAVGLLSLLRNEGGSVGVSLGQTFQERRDQFHTLRLGEYLDPFNAAANSFLATRLGLSSCSRPPIRLRRSNSPGSNSRICASSKHLRSLISTAFG
jgi:DHA2 family multidrug resistance protein